MAESVDPKVFHLATTQLTSDAAQYLDHIGAHDWTTDTADDHSALIEMAGRACYRSFGVGLNANVTRVREGNRNYIGNSILSQKHGSVLEHATDTFALTGVSRILTHELVRHRQGTAFSQESGRYVRIEHLEYYYPEALKSEFLRTVYDDLKSSDRSFTDGFDEWSDQVVDSFNGAMDAAEFHAVELEKLLGLDNLSNFGLKKKLQSAIRRVAPNGQGNTIIVTANHRAWRHIIGTRTAGGAEEEIRLVKYMIFNKLDELHPNIYQDASLLYDEDALPKHIPVVVFANDKV